MGSHSTSNGLPSLIALLLSSHIGTSTTSFFHYSAWSAGGSKAPPPPLQFSGHTGHFLTRIPVPHFSRGNSGLLHTSILPSPYPGATSLADTLLPLLGIRLWHGLHFTAALLTPLRPQTGPTSPQLPSQPAFAATSTGSRPSPTYHLPLNRGPPLPL